MVFFNEENFIFFDANDAVDLSTVTLSEQESYYLETITHPRRKEEFLRGRAAISQLLKVSSSDRGKGGELVLPYGTVGSISHSRGHVVAFAQVSTDFASFGIDLEFVDRISEKLRDKILTPLEDKQWGKDPVFLQLAFSVKEAFFKCLFPIVKALFDFDAVSIVGWDQTLKTLTLEPHLHPQFKKKLTAGYTTISTTAGEALLTWCLLGHSASNDIVIM